MDAAEAVLEMKRMAQASIDSWIPVIYKGITIQSVVNTFPDGLNIKLLAKNKLGLTIHTVEFGIPLEPTVYRDPITNLYSSHIDNEYFDYAMIENSIKLRNDLNSMYGFREESEGNNNA
jgi:hypothetical protein